MSSAHINILLEMGASRHQAVRALSKYKEVMEAADAIFSGAFDELDNESEEIDESTGEGIHDRESAGLSEVEGDDGDEDGDGEEDESCYDSISVQSEPEHNIDWDPYKDLNLSKDRRETVIELEQICKQVKVKVRNKKVIVREMTQAQWMKGCPEGSEQSGLGENAFTCPTCHSIENCENTSLFVLSDSVDNYLTYLEEKVQRCCAECQTEYCTACRAILNREEASLSGKGKGKKKEREEEHQDNNKLLHCVEVQAAILGVGLAHVEKLMDDSLITDETSKMEEEGKTKKRPLSIMDDHSQKGTGYAGDSLDDWKWHEEQKKKQEKIDKSLCDSLRILRDYLPNTCRPFPVSSDFLPHIASIAQVRRRFLPVVSRLLQSDSLVDMSERFELYQEVVGEWFKAFAKNEALVPLLAQPIMLPKNVSYTIRKDKEREKTVTYEGSEGPRELAQSILMQCRAFLENIERHRQAEQLQDEKPETVKVTEQNKTTSATTKGKMGTTPGEDAWQTEQQELQRFAKSFIQDVASIDLILRGTKGDNFVDKFVGHLQDNSHDSKEETDVKSSDKEKDEKEEVSVYEAWAKSQCYDDCDMTTKISSGVLYSHAFYQEIQDTNSSGNHKRGFTIAKELASLRVSLPSLWNGSIFLRVDESRIDILKACIVGPEGSPYQNGLFMFDIFLPSTYNQSSPLVKIVTTANGTVRFNPNLYANGKVCLSLLGTWAGPGWKSGQSTLLQVLISLQSLVMGVEEPALNEPGWSSLAGKPGSIAYSKNCRRQTVAVAMLRHLNEPLAPWKSVIEGHFRLKASSIASQLDQWAEEDDGRSSERDGTSVIHRCTVTETNKVQTKEGASKNKFQKDVAILKNLLQQQPA